MASISVAGIAPVIAGGESRTISLYHIHTGESLTVTYMENGRYIPSAMKKINYLLRDWRKDEVTTIDPRSIDLVWELHQDLGSEEPVHIVCGYRSASTNALLHRIGRNVAKESQHIAGKAIDFYFPDVPTVKIRNVALVREVGGVGYYRSAGGPTGFLHIDSGHVRHWGPGISDSQMAEIFREGKKYVGRHLSRPSSGGSDQPGTQVASTDSGDGQAPIGPLGRLLGWGKKETPAPVPVQTAKAAPPPKANDDDGANAQDQADLADLSGDIPEMKRKPAVKPASGSNVSQDQMASLGDLTQDAAAARKAKVIPLPAPTQVAAADDEQAAPERQVKTGRLIPKPRIKPVEIMLMAAANMKTAPSVVKIQAASAPPTDQSGHEISSPAADSLSTLMANVSETPAVPKPRPVAADSIQTATVNASAKSIPVLKPMMATAGTGINWWPQILLRQDEQVRRNGELQLMGTVNEDALPKEAKLPENTGGGTSTAFAADMKVLTDHSAEGKGDLE